MQSEPTSSPPPRDTRKLVRVEGHPGVYRRGSRYVVVMRANGRQVKRSCRTLAEAKRVRAEITTDAARGEFHRGGRMTFEQYGRDWIDRYEGRTQGGIRESTIANYRATLDADAFPALGRMRMCDITLGDLKRFAADLAAGRRKGFSKRKDPKTGQPVPLAGRPLSKNAVRLALAPVKAMLAEAHEEGVIRGNPASGLRIVIPKPKARQRDEKALSAEQLRALLDALPERWRLLFEFMAHTGVRVGEALALRWRNVNLTEGYVRVEERFYRGSFDDPKSEFGIREIPITPAMVEALGQRWREAKPSSGDALVFGSAGGTPLNAANLYNRVFKKAARTAAVGHATFHTLRHTAGTLLRDAGYSADEIQRVLGHHAPSFTMDVYVHPRERPAAPAFMDEVTRGTTGGSASPAKGSMGSDHFEADAL